MPTFVPHMIKSLFWKIRSGRVYVFRRYPILWLCLLILLQSVIFYYTFLSSTALNTFSYPIEVDLYKLYEHSRSSRAFKEEINPRPINPTYFPIINSFNHSRKKRSVVFFVKSLVTNSEQRNAIRQTWGSHNCWGRYRDQTEFIFIVGKPNPLSSSYETIQEQIQVESMLHSDIVQFDIIDIYQNLTYKLMAALQMVTHDYADTKFVVLLDDDYFVHPRNLWRIMSKVTQTQYPIYVAGDIARIPRPVRFFFHRWFISYQDYPFSVYPPFPSGGTVIMSSPLARLVSFGLGYTKFLPFEDVLLGIVLFKLGISPIQVEEIFSIRTFHGDLKSVVSAHGFKDPTKLLADWSSLPLSDLCNVS